MVFGLCSLLSLPSSCGGTSDGFRLPIAFFGCQWQFLLSGAQLWLLWSPHRGGDGRSPTYCSRLGCFSSRTLSFCSSDSDIYAGMTEICTNQVSDDHRHE